MSFSSPLKHTPPAAPAEGTAEGTLPDLRRRATDSCLPYSTCSFSTAVTLRLPICGKALRTPACSTVPKPALQLPLYSCRATSPDLQLLLYSRCATATAPEAGTALQLLLCGSCSTAPEPAAGALYSSSTWTTPTSAKHS